MKSSATPTDREWSRDHLNPPRLNWRLILCLTFCPLAYIAIFWIVAYAWGQG
jgi:hypothetical protein